MLLYVGEERFIAISFANDPAVVDGATVTATGLDVVFLERRGEAEVAGAIVTTADPAPPAVVSPEVRLWVDLADVDPGRYIVRATTELSNGETAQAETAVVVE